VTTGFPQPPGRELCCPILLEYGLSAYDRIVSTNCTLLRAAAGLAKCFIRLSGEPFTGHRHASHLVSLSERDLPFPIHPTDSVFASIILRPPPLISCCLPSGPWASPARRCLSRCDPASNSTATSKTQKTSTDRRTRKEKAKLRGPSRPRKSPRHGNSHQLRRHQQQPRQHGAPLIPHPSALRIPDSPWPISIFQHLSR
jgi:hypothetical protein